MIDYACNKENTPRLFQGFFWIAASHLSQHRTSPLLDMHVTFQLTNDVLVIATSAPAFSPGSPPAEFIHARMLRSRLFYFSPTP
jgi:hypothetical protein